MRLGVPAETLVHRIGAFNSSLAGRLSEAGRVVLHRSGKERERTTAK